MTKYKTLSEFMEKYNFSAGKLGKRIGVKRQTVQAWTKGGARPHETKSLVALQRVVKEYDPTIDASKWFDYSKPERRGRPPRNLKKV